MKMMKISTDTTYKIIARIDMIIAQYRRFPPPVFLCEMV